MVRVLVCGWREWDDEQIVHRVLDGFLADVDSPADTVVIIEGCAPGADHCAETWVDNMRNEVNIEHLHFPARWDKYGKPAGPIRNQQMLDEGQPDIVIAFHDDIAKARGTGDMVKRAAEAGIPVYVVSHYGAVR